MEHFVELLVVVLGVGLNAVSFGLVVVVDVYDDVTVIGTAHQVLNGVEQAERAPVFAQDDKAFVLLALIIGRIGCHIALNQIKVLVHRLDDGVVCPREHLFLHEESGAVDIVHGIVFGVEITAVVGDDEELAVVVQQALRVGLDIVVNVGGLLFADVIHQVDKRAGFDELFGVVAAVHQVGVILARDFNAQGFLQIAREELKLELQAEFLFDHLEYFVVAGGLVTGLAHEHSHGEGLFSHRAEGQDRQHQDCQHQGKNQPE